MSIDSDFVQFHAENPEVYDMIVDLARQAKRAGRSRLGMKMLFEVVRWQKFITTTDPDFKLNNNYTSRYARLIMDRESDLAEMFQVRALRAA